MPKDLHSTHISIYAVHPMLAHTDHRNLQLHNFNLDDEAPIPKEDDAMVVVQLLNLKIADPISPVKPKKMVQ